jgi:hypothetical protein
LISLATLTGCATMTASSVPVTRTACLAFPYITWSKKDTDATIEQIKEFNAARKALCK